MKILWQIQVIVPLRIGTAGDLLANLTRLSGQPFDLNIAADLGDSLDICLIFCAKLIEPHVKTTLIGSLKHHGAIFFGD
jgi:hypothetical protein